VVHFQDCYLTYCLTWFCIAADRRARWYLECAEHCSCKADGDMFDAELTARGLRQVWQSPQPQAVPYCSPVSEPISLTIFVNRIINPLFVVIYLIYINAPTAIYEISLIPSFILFFAHCNATSLFIWFYSRWFVLCNVYKKITK